MKRKEYRNICLIASDSWSGNHLLRKRTADYGKIRKELYKAFNSHNPNNRQRELIEAYARTGGDLIY